MDMSNALIFLSPRMRQVDLFHILLMLVRLDFSTPSYNLSVRDNDICEGNPRYSQCGEGYPATWCCKTSETCLPVNSTSTTVVLCCPAGSDCASIQTIACETSNNSLSSVHILDDSPQLLSCGAFCCPPGFACTSGICTIEPSLGLVPTSLPRPNRKTFGGGVGVGIAIGVPVGAVVIGCMGWFLIRRREKPPTSMTPKISWPRPQRKSEQNGPEDEYATLVQTSSIKAGEVNNDQRYNSPYEELRPLPLSPSPYKREQSVPQQQGQDRKSSQPDLNHPAYRRNATPDSIEGRRF